MRSLRAHTLSIEHFPQVTLSAPLPITPADSIQFLCRAANQHEYPPIIRIHTNKLNVLQIIQHKVWPRRLDFGPLMARQQPNHIAVCSLTSSDARGCIFDHEDSGVFGYVEQSAGEEVACEE